MLLNNSTINRPTALGNFYVILKVIKFNFKNKKNFVKIKILIILKLKMLYRVSINYWRVQYKSVKIIMANKYDFKQLINFFYFTNDGCNIIVN